MWSIFDVHRSRWLSLVLGQYIMVTAGTIYLFPAYSSVLRSRLGFSVAQTDFISTMLNLGTWMSVFGGLLYDAVGPRPTGVLAALLVFLGYFLMYLAVNDQVDNSHVAVGWYALLVGQGSGFLYCVALNTQLKNFSSKSRGKLVGLLACFFGLCSGVFTQIYKGLFIPPGQTDGDLSSFLLFLSICIPAVAVVGSLFSLAVPNPSHVDPPEAEPRRVLAGYAIAITIAIYVAVSALTETFTNADVHHLVYVLFVLLASFPVLAIKIDRLSAPVSPYTAIINSDEPSNGKGEATAAATNTASSTTPPAEEPSAPLLPETPNQASDPSQPLSATNWPRMLPIGCKAMPQTTTHYSLWRSLASLDFAIIFVIFMLGIGAGITVVNNLAEIVYSRLPPSYNGQTIPSSAVPNSKDNAAFVVLFSVTNTLGRLLSGYISDTFSYPRLMWLLFACILMACAQLTFALAAESVLYFGILLLGLAYGSFFCIIPSWVSEAFGVASFGATFGLQGLAPAIGSEVFSTAIAGNMADQERRHGYVNITSSGGTSSLHCLGRDCFRNSLIINVGGCLLALVATAVLIYRQSSLTGDTVIVLKARVARLQAAERLKTESVA